MSPRPPSEAAAARGALQRSAFQDDVLAGLQAPQKTLPAKYFYDAAGSALFDRICELPEYYPTRTERAILEAHAPQMAANLGARALLIEPGAGSGVKTRLLLSALEDPVAYVPVDISGEHLQDAATQLRTEYPSLEVLPVVADFTQDWQVPATQRVPSRRALFFPGSTLGNFEPVAAARLLARLRAVAGRSGRLLLGVDLHKDVAVLERAYNDAEGVTAAFNLNLLARINRELDGSFDLEAFAHHALYDTQRQRIEMHLVSQRDQVVRVAGQTLRLRRGETIHTENSYKYDQGRLEAIARDGGWRLAAQWRDARDWFALCLLVPSV